MSDAEYLRLKRLADRAATLLCDADFLEMLADLKSQAIRKWSESPGPDGVSATHSWHDLHAVARLELLMKQYGEALRMQAHKNGR